MDNWYPLLWLGAAALLVVIELATPQLVSIWFALGAAVTALVALTGLPLAAQLAVFALVSCAALLLSRPLARRVLETRKVRTNADAVVGTRGVVTEGIDNLREEGRVQAGGLSWSARSGDGTPIPKDTTVEVERIDGVKLIVRPIPTPKEEPET